MQFIAFQIQRANRKEIAECTISNYYKATKLFCEMNDLSLSWKKISRGSPIGRRAANDRAPHHRRDTKASRISRPTDKTNYLYDGFFRN